jgi:hypothetical protein
LLRPGTRAVAFWHRWYCWLSPAIDICYGKFLRRALLGAEAWLAIRSYLSTAAKNGVNLLDALQRLCLNDPWMPVPTAASP